VFTTLLYLKLAIGPVIVFSVSYLQRRFGDRFGGWLIGLPITTGPFILIVCLQEGIAFGGHTARGILLGQMALIAFCWVYAQCVLRLSWLPAIILATFATVLVGYLVTAFKVSDWVTTPILILFWLICMRFWPKSAGEVQKISHPHWELPIRIIFTITLMVGLSALAPHLGAKIAGALSTYPVIASVIGAFNHRRFGPSATISTLRGLMQTLPITMTIIFGLALVLR